MDIRSSLLHDGQMVSYLFHYCNGSKAIAIQEYPLYPGMVEDMADHRRLIITGEIIATSVIMVDAEIFSFRGQSADRLQRFAKIFETLG